MFIDITSDTITTGHTDYGFRSEPPLFAVKCCSPQIRARSHSLNHVHHHGWCPFFATVHVIDTVDVLTVVNLTKLDLSSVVVGFSLGPLPALGPPLIGEAGSLFFFVFI